ncbi:MAG TPA: hypothetical protein VG796_26120 [Verrucomicrobiales bacterium]|jgi:hypothetical protein|nr:hypothetical protein [Verrucomicrobiales bacterium]
MNTRPLFCLLFVLLLASPLRAAVSPVPVVTLEKVNLPKVTVRISNPDKTTECRIWAFGNSWEEQNKWFSLRTSAGDKVAELHPQIRCYTVNFPRSQSIPAGGFATFEYDLSDNSQDGWNCPRNFVPGKWDFEIRAHLEIPREVDAHRHGVFIGEVTSPWYNTSGRETGPANKSRPDASEAAIEGVKKFPWKRLVDSIEKWQTTTLPDNQSLGDFFGADFPWDRIQTHLDTAHEGCTLAVLLPDHGLMSLEFRSEQHALTKRFKKEHGWPHSHYGWIDAKSILAITPAAQIQNIQLERGLKGVSASFKRGPAAN